jgi:ABC-type multidrug transport system fused ATPase/permease subunit
MLILCVICLYRYKRENYNYKIYNFHWNTFIISIYISVFIILVFIIRVKRVGMKFNIINFYNKLFKYIVTNPFLINMISVLCILITFLILKAVINYFIKEVFKRHLHFYYNKKYKDMREHIEKYGTLFSGIVKYHPYVQFIDKISDYYSYGYIILYYRITIFTHPYCILLGIKTYPTWMGKPLTTILLNMHHILLFILIIGECFLNNWTLHIVFYYLPLYIFIRIYKRITDFLYNTNTEINRIFYERYYEENKILYVNTTDKEEAFFIRYVQNNFKCFSHNIDDLQKKFDMLGYTQIFTSVRRFCKSTTNASIFINEDTQEEFDIKDMIIKEDKLRNSLGFRYLTVPYEDE